jgi:hypothetical protein
MHKASLNDKETIVDLLCKTFDTNISANFIVKQDNKRKERLRVLMNYAFDICYMFGNIYLSTNKDACALTLLPDHKKTTLKTIKLELKLVFNCIGLNRIFKVLNRERKLKSYQPKKPIIYLWVFGVDKDQQSKGTGSRLLRELIQESEKQKRAIYLETSMEKNLIFYKKNGFEIFHELNVGHKIFLIRREID